MAGKSRPRILVVDDDADTRFALSYILGDAGYDVVEASDASSIVRMASDRRVDLILLDLVLPKLSGFDALVRLKASRDTRDVPVVVVTALARRADIDEARARGASACILKPWAAGEVERCVGRILCANREAEENEAGARSPA